MNRDKYGIIGQIQKGGLIEGGDSANWMGHYIYLTNDDFPFVETFEIKPGAYVRHPDPEQTNNGFGAHYKNPWNGCISRDQLTGIIGALIKKKEYLALTRLILHHAASLFLLSYNNINNGQDPKIAKWKRPDPTLLNIWACYLRGFGIFSWLLYPLLCILDLHVLIDTLRANSSDEEDKISYALRLFISRDYVPTIVGKLSVKLLNKQHLIKNIEKYWCGWRKNCEMSDLYKKKIEELN